MFSPGFGQIQEENDLRCWQKARDGSEIHDYMTEWRPRKNHFDKRSLEAGNPEVFQTGLQLPLWYT